MKLAKEKIFLTFEVKSEICWDNYTLRNGLVRILWVEFTDFFKMPIWKILFTFNAKFWPINLISEDFNHRFRSPDSTFIGFYGPILIIYELAQTSYILDS